MTTTSKRQQSAKLPVIESGECGWPDCTEPNQPGVWSKGGSWMCKEHKPIIDEVRKKYAEEEDPYGTRERAAEERGERKPKKKRPTCTVPGCDEPRPPGEVKCALHREDDEEEY